jgi:MYXO-CTERM domain-containing protein
MAMWVMGRFGIPLAAVLAFARSAAAQSAGQVFQQSGDGLVVMEAERAGGNTAQGGHTWDPVTTPAGFVGTGAMQSNPNSGAGVDTGFAAGSPRLDFNVLFASTGTHYVWVRGRALTAPATGNNDSCHVGIGGAETATADRMSGWGDAWTWRNATMDSAVATLTVASAGIHTVNLWMREDGFIVDRILLTTNSAYTGVTNGGTMAGPAESAQVAVVGAPGTLVATPAIESVQLSWGAATNADAYELRRSTVPGGPYTVIAAGLTGLAYTDTAVIHPTTYYYVVVGVNEDFGTGPLSNEASAAPVLAPPRYNDHEEGTEDRACSCGVAGFPAPWAVLAAALAALLPRRRRR